MVWKPAEEVGGAERSSRPFYNQRDDRWEDR
jgi:hypothetical protein